MIIKGIRIIHYNIVCLKKRINYLQIIYFTKRIIFCINLYKQFYMQIYKVEKKGGEIMAVKKKAVKKKTAKKR
jgi:hypothetical protein